MVIPPPPPRAGSYQVIYADPPWTFRTWSARGKGRSPEAWYDCMAIEEIAALPVAKWAGRDCVLLLWTTDPLLPRAFEVIRAWGFVYRTVGFCWVKLRPRARLPLEERDFFLGLGYWTRANAELCLLATRGHPRRLAADVPRLVVSPRREHSRKPEEIYGRIERLVAGPYLELFARSHRPGWDSWGLESGLFDRTVPRRRWKSVFPPPVSPAGAEGERPLPDADGDPSSCP